MQRLLKKLFGKILIFSLWLATIGFTACGVFQRMDEEWAIRGMNQIRRAEEAFKKTKGHFGNLEELRSSGLMVPSIEQYGYQFAVRATSDSYVAVATPIRSKDISMSLYLDHSGTIRGKHKQGAEATANDPPLRGYGDNP